MIYAWIISSLIAGEILLFLCVFWFRDRESISDYPPGWYYFLLTLGMFVMANTSLFAYIDSLGRLERLKGVIARRIEVNGLIRSILEMEGSQRGYMLTGRESYLTPYHVASKDIRSRINVVRGSYRGMEDEELAIALCRLAELKAQEMDDTLATYRNERPVPFSSVWGRGRAIEAVQGDTGKNLMDLFRMAYDDILKRNLEHYERDRTGMSHMTSVRILMAVLVVVGSVIQMVFGVYKHRRFRRDATLSPALETLTSLNLSRTETGTPP